MRLRLERIARKATYTIGKLYVDGAFFCNTLEDTDRGLSSDMAEEEIAVIKVKDRTAIPTGTYRVDMDTISPRYSTSQFMREYANGGRVPRLMGVPGFEGVLIHVGNTPEDTSGCILVGRNTVVGRVTSSRDTFKELYPLLWKARGDLTIAVY